MSFSHQLSIQLHFEVNKPRRYKIFAHNKGQMLFPRHDNIFGSHTYDMDWDPERVSVNKAYGRISFRQHLELERIHLKAIDTPEARCDVENKDNTTECIAKYLEDSIGCSMGMAGSRMKTERLLNCYNQVFLSSSFLIKGHFQMHQNKSVSGLFQYG